MKLTTLLTILNQLKIFHWQTKSYAQHQAFGAAYDSLEPLIDEFIEVYMGKYGRIKAKEKFVITVENYSDNKPVDVINDFVTIVQKDLVKDLTSENDSELLNIKDEMLAVLNKLKYLLTLS